MQKNIVFLNQDFCAASQAKIPITDRGFLFGEGCFTTIRLEEGLPELLDAHLERLHDQALLIGLTAPQIQKEWIQKLIEHNQAQTGTWRLKIIWTEQTCLMTLKQEALIAWEPCRLNIFPFPLEYPLAELKTLAYLNQLQVCAYAQQKDYEDAITLTKEGFVLETSCANLFWITPEGCWVPDFSLPYLKGVFLQALLKVLPLPVHFVHQTFATIPLHAQIYTCNALRRIRPVVSIEKISFARCEKIEELLKQVTVKILKAPN